MNWPQYTMIVLMALGVFLHAALDGERVIGAKYNFGTKLLTTILYAWILWCGGFWGTHL